MSSGQLATYPDSRPIFPGDIVQFQPVVGALEDMYGRVVFFGRDKRALSSHHGEIVLRLQLVQLASTISELSDVPHTGEQPGSDDWVLLEHSIVEVPPSQITLRAKIGIRWTPTTLPPDFENFACVYSSSTHHVRPVSKLAPTSAELEVHAYGREHLEAMITMPHFISLPLLWFYDEFGLHRNMYRAILGIYFSLAGLSLEERTRASNQHTLTLGPHSAIFADFMEPLKPGLVALEEGCRMDIQGTEYLVCAPTLAFIGDMKGQQASAGFLSPRGNLSCRMCYAGPDNRDDMDIDLDLHRRYHFETMAEREATTTMAWTQRKKVLAEKGLLMEESPLAAITPALDITRSRPIDVAHSEFLGITRRLVRVVMTEMLTKKAAGEFVKKFQSFIMPPGWSRIQSPSTHMQSWTATECARASIIFPIVLRFWLSSTFLRKPYTDRLKQNTGEVDVVSYIIKSMAMIARSNTLVASTVVDIKDIDIFHAQCLSGRRAFLELMNAAPKAGTTHKPRRTKKQASRSRRRDQRSTTPADSEPDSQMENTQDASDAASVLSDNSAVSGGSFMSDGDLEEAPGIAADHVVEKMAALPNTHVVVHFADMCRLYANLWNVDGLAGEAHHK
jgi:hypothetical protein